MSEETKYVAVIGGLNMDIAGISGEGYREKDSNIGRIILSPGGVGRNIAHNLVELEVPTYLVTAYGDDDFGFLLERSCKKLGIRLDYADKELGERSSTYLYVTDDEGDMITGVNDMKIVDHITPAFLEDKLAFLNQATIVVLDANLPQETIEWATEHITVPIFAEPVSTAKAGRFTGVLNKIDTIKPNEHEAELFTGIKVVDVESAKRAAQKMIDLGVKHVYISIGARGMVAADKDKVIHVPVLSTKVVSANGAGDCAMATIVWNRYRNQHASSTKEVAQLAQAAANITLQSEHSVAPELNVTNVVHTAMRYNENK